jgi:hypothetical protein
VLQESSINTLLFKGAVREKLVLELPLYGYIFKLKSTEGNVGFGSATEGEGNRGPYSQDTESWAYNEVSFCTCDGISRRETE